MSRRRYITTLISVDKRIRRLSDSAALLYTWMIPHAEEDASLDADPEELAATVTPNRPGWTAAKVSKCCDEIAELGLFTLYENRYYFPPVAFYRVQSNIHMDKRRTWHPDKKPCVDIETAENSGEQRRTAENSASPSPSPSPSKHLSSSALDEFACFWQEYPRKEGKGRARESFLAARRKVGSAAIMAGLAQQRHIMAAKEMRYIPLPATWLNQERWSDEVEDGPPGQPRVDPHARETRIANARAQLAGGMEPDLARGMVKDDLEWQEVMKSAIG